ncbi:MAG: transglutaminase family protein [Acidimicrobiia bacterium]
MTDLSEAGVSVAGDPLPGASRTLLLNVGCTLGLQSTSRFAAVLQVAPALVDGITIQRELWDTDAEHHSYVDRYGNRCERFVFEAGDVRVGYQAEVARTSDPDPVVASAIEIPPHRLPDDLLHYVMPSRFCLSDELGNEAWQRFADHPPGWGRVQAIVDYVHGYLDYVPGSSNPWTTAADVYRAGQGVCRDFAHLAITFCRALNIPARYVFGYIPDIGVPLPDEPMDFSAWFEANLGGQWYTFDARLNTPRIGRVIVGRGRDAVDVALLTSFGAPMLTNFQVTAEPV